eukprot:g2064.t1
MPAAQVFDSHIEDDYWRRKDEDARNARFRRLEARGERDGTHGITWYQTLNPCHKDPYIKNEAKHRCCCCQLNALSVVYIWTMIAGLLSGTGIFYFFASILEFSEHWFFYADEFMALSIFFVLAGVWIGSRTIWIAHHLGHQSEALPWAPIWCPGVLCHKCCSSKKERRLFCKQRCSCYSNYKRRKTLARLRKQHAQHVDRVPKTGDGSDDELGEHDTMIELVTRPPQERIYLDDNDIVGYTREDIERMALDIERREKALAERKALAAATQANEAQTGKAKKGRKKTSKKRSSKLKKQLSKDRKKEEKARRRSRSMSRESVDSWLENSPKPPKNAILENIERLVESEYEGDNEEPKRERPSVPKPKKKKSKKAKKGKKMPGKEKAASKKPAPPASLPPSGKETSGRAADASLPQNGTMTLPQPRRPGARVMKSVLPSLKKTKK